MKIIIEAKDIGCISIQKNRLLTINFKDLPVLGGGDSIIIPIEEIEYLMPSKECNKIKEEE